MAARPKGTILAYQDVILKKIFKDLSNEIFLNLEYGKIKCPDFEYAVIFLILCIISKR